MFDMRRFINVENIFKIKKEENLQHLDSIFVFFLKNYFVDVDEAGFL